MSWGGLVSSAVVTALMRRCMRNHPGRRILLDVERILARGGGGGRSCDDLANSQPTSGGGGGGGDNGAASPARADNNIHTAINRLKTYHKHHRPTMDWLKLIKVPIVKLDCSGSKENVWQQLMAIGRLMRPVVKIPPTALGRVGRSHRGGSLHGHNHNGQHGGHDERGNEDMQLFA